MPREIHHPGGRTDATKSSTIWGKWARIKLPQDYSTCFRKKGRINRTCAFLSCLCLPNGATPQAFPYSNGSLSREKSRGGRTSREPSCNSRIVQGYRC